MTWPVSKKGHGRYCGQRNLLLVRLSIRIGYHNPDFYPISTETIVKDNLILVFPVWCSFGNFRYQKGKSEPQFELIILAQPGVSHAKKSNKYRLKSLFNQIIRLLYTSFLQTTGYTHVHVTKILKLFLSEKGIPPLRSNHGLGRVSYQLCGWWTNRCSGGYRVFWLLGFDSIVSKMPEKGNGEHLLTWESSKDTMSNQAK